MLKSASRKASGTGITMLRFLPDKTKGIISSLLLGLNVIFWVTILFILSLLKFLLPVPPLRRFFDHGATALEIALGVPPVAVVTGASQTVKSTLA